jgi:hypothetical protein
MMILTTTTTTTTMMMMMIVVKVVVVVPNVVVEWLTLLLHIREVPGSNICPKTDCPEFFRGFPQPLQANVRIVP